MSVGVRSAPVNSATVKGDYRQRLLQIFMDATTAPCPVPEEQQPLNEYKALQASWLFSWAMLPWPGLLKRLSLVAGFSFLLISPVCVSAFSPEKWPVQFILVSVIAALVLPFLTLIQLYVGWRHVRDRLNAPRVFYEESGWYDGQYWTKPEDILTQDQLVVTYQVQPLMRRIEQLFGGIALVLLGQTILWSIL